MKLYPFPAKVVSPTGAILVSGVIIKLNPLGVLMQVPAVTSLKVADQLRLHFDLPQSKVSFDEPIKLIKAYTNWGVAPDGTRTKVQIFEWHFLELASSKKSVIDRYNALNQSSE